MIGADVLFHFWVISSPLYRKTISLEFGCFQLPVSDSFIL